MPNIIEVLNSYSGRDKIIRTTTYLALLATGAVKSQKSVVKLKTLVAQLSACRTVLRLFDDIPALAYTLNSGFGKQHESTLMRSLDCLGKWSILAFYPVEHLAWASEHKLINIHSSTTSRLWRYSVTLWFVYLLANIVRCIRQIQVLQSQKQILKKGKKEEWSKSSSSDDPVSEAASKQGAVAVTLLTHLADVVIAVNFLSPRPGAFLWSSSLQAWQLGLAGTLSSLIGLARLVRS